MTEHTWQKAGSKNRKSETTTPSAQPPKCPECTSQKVWKDGIRHTRHSEVQRWLCRDCGHRFSQLDVKVNIFSQINKTLNPRSNLLKSRVVPLNFSVQEISNSSPFPGSENIGPHELTIIGKRLNTFPSYSSKRQVCVNKKKMKNLVATAQTKQQVAGATKPTEADIKSKIIEMAWHMKKEGYKDPTISSRTRLLERLNRLGANLFDPENVKTVIANQKWCEGTKLLNAYAYKIFAEINDITFAMPKYRPVEHLPFIPLEKEIDQLIAACGKKLAAFLQALKETGARRGEIYQLKWIDIDEERNAITINNPEKNSRPRILKMSSKLIVMLKQLPKKSEKVFATKSGVVTLGISLCRKRKKLARKLANPRISKITFHTLRHWKATMEYQRTRDILYVKKLLGHKRIENTLVYTQLVNFESNEYHVKVAETLDEACELVKAGFEYVTEVDGGKIFRKRK